MERQKHCQLNGINHDINAQTVKMKVILCPKHTLCEMLSYYGSNRSRLSL